MPQRRHGCKHSRRPRRDANFVDLFRDRYVAAAATLPSGGGGSNRSRWFSTLEPEQISLLRSPRVFGAVWPLRIASDSRKVENGLILRWKLKSVTIWLVFQKHANDAMSTYAKCGYKSFIINTLLKIRLWTD